MKAHHDAEADHHGAATTGRETAIETVETVLEALEALNGRRRVTKIKMRNSMVEGKDSSVATGTDRGHLGKSVNQKATEFLLKTSLVSRTSLDPRRHRMPRLKSKTRISPLRELLPLLLRRRLLMESR